ncbi:hypothetical protein Rcae01_04855 [Novipirellula caenicola]|uniref:Uncharacterized protein n=2 Tax=Novipirellula caenicola TaxID=1536901 RepID=A0ABP9VW65_9BACT
MPTVVADEHTVLLAFLCSDETVTIITFARCSTHMFGPPNDESFGAHPLAKRGLRHYTAAEVHNSSWLDARIAMNRVHRQHSDALFAHLRHFIFPFHDSTFECLAADFSVTPFAGSMADAVSHMASLLTGS